LCKSHFCCSFRTAVPILLKFGTPIHHKITKRKKIFFGGHLVIITIIVFFYNVQLMSCVPNVRCVFFLNPGESCCYVALYREMLSLFSSLFLFSKNLFHKCTTFLEILQILFQTTVRFHCSNCVCVYDLGQGVPIFNHKPINVKTTIQSVSIFVHNIGLNRGQLFFTLNSNILILRKNGVYKGGGSQLLTTNITFTFKETAFVIIADIRSYIIK